MSTNVKLVYLPALEGKGCSCGTACGPAAARTSNEDARAMLDRLKAEFGDGVELAVADYSTAEGVRSAALELKTALEATGGRTHPVSSQDLGSMLSVAGPFLLLDGTIVANGRLPSLATLKHMVTAAVGVGRTKEDRAAD